MFYIGERGLRQPLDKEGSLDSGQWEEAWDMSLIQQATMTGEDPRRHRLTGLQGSKCVRWARPTLLNNAESATEPTKGGVFGEKSQRHSKRGVDGEGSRS